MQRNLLAGAKTFLSVKTVGTVKLFALDTLRFNSKMHWVVTIIYLSINFIIFVLVAIDFYSIICNL